MISVVVKFATAGWKSLVQVRLTEHAPTAFPCRHRAFAHVRNKSPGQVDRRCLNASGRTKETYAGRSFPPFARKADIDSLDLRTRRERPASNVSTQLKQSGLPAGGFQILDIHRSWPNFQGRAPLETVKKPFRSKQISTQYCLGLGVDLPASSKKNTLEIALR